MRYKISSLIKYCVPLGVRERVKRLMKGPVHYKEWYGAHSSGNSVDFREHEQLLRDGDIPEKVLRLLPLINGNTVLEIGSAEGILSLVLAESKDRVVSVDITPARQQTAKELQEMWRQTGKRGVEKCEFVCGDIFDRLDLLDGIQTVIASRVIYYFHEGMNDLMVALIKHGVENVVLVGNEYRATAWDTKQDGKELGRYAYFSTISGMRELLEKHGYEIVHVLADGDPVVVGRRSV